WIALFVSVALHAAAVAIAGLDRESIPTANVSGPNDPMIEILNDPLPPDAPEIETIETPSPPPLIDEDSFPVETSTPSPAPRNRKTVPPIPHTTSIRANGLTSPGSARIFALSAPRPEYPYEARRQRLTGDGVAMIAIDPGSG